MSESKAYAAVLLAIGTELSAGQVINSNTAWLAAHLDEAGVAPLLHLTLPDDRGLILAALQFAAQQSDLLILSGGLGPTSDDFTREVVAQWLELPLYFEEASWQRLEARAQALQFSLGASQKQQCWFPESATVLPNPAGTADAFWLQQDPLKLFVLPGPPREIAALWQAGLAEALQPFLPQQQSSQLFKWQCLGVSEGSIAEALDQALAGQGVLTGYRAHAPYIELKVWIPAGVATQPILETVEKVAQPWIVLQQNEDAAELLLASLPEQPVRIMDYATGGQLAHRLQSQINRRESRELQLEVLTSWQSQAVSAQQALSQLAEERENPHEMILMLSAEAEHWSLGMLLDQDLHFEQFDLPVRYNQAYRQQYICEKTLLTWRNWLDEKRV